MQSCIVGRMEDISLQVAREELDEWARDRARVDKTRDPLVRRALSAGVPKIEVRRRTGIARTTIDRIAASSG